MKGYTAEEKVMILKKHLLEGKKVSELCEEYDIHVSTFYDWQKMLFENGAKAFRKEEYNSKQKKNKEKIKGLEETLSRRETALAELLEEHIDLKKKLGVL